MFIKLISKEQYNKMQKKIDDLERDLRIATSSNDYLTTRYEDVKKTCRSLEDDIKHKSSENIQLQKSVSAQIDTNQKLNEWIEKILNEVGIRELHERTGVTIPVYINDQMSAYNAVADKPFIYERKEIIIPELRFVKMG